MNYTEEQQKEKAGVGEEEDAFTGEQLPTWALAVVGSLHTLTCVNGVAGSLLVLTALLTIPCFRTPSSSTYTVFLGNLTLTDLYFQTYFFPTLIIGFILGRYPAVNTAHCLVNAYAAMCCYSVFVLTLTAISFDRYMRVCHPSAHRRHFSWRSSVGLCLAIWVVGGLVPLRGALRGQLGFDTKTLLCFTKATADGSVSLPYLLCFFFALFASAFFNVRICTVYRAVRRRVQQSSASSAAAESADHRRRAAAVASATASVSASAVVSLPQPKTVSSSDLSLLRSVVVILLCLVVLVTPGSVTRALRSRVEVDGTLYAFFVWLLSLGNSIDWVVYGLFNRRFRRGYRAILTRYRYRFCCCCTCCAEEQSATSTDTPD
ncbi:melatonin receptor type 1B-B-like [Babylonia areolata]|uniref:melatonin receptor type 1B-B-like n=1 Tax=Babylonia areolata TaxID=304850 RepID=UPI003FD3FC92